MDPNNQGSQGGDVPSAPPPQGQNTPASTPQPDHEQQQSAAANMIRTQINALYDNPARNRVAERETPPQTDNDGIPGTDRMEVDPYGKTHVSHPQPQAEQWKAYHSAWQNYYQQYYQSFYEQKHAVETRWAEEQAAAQASDAGKAANEAASQQLFSQQTDLQQTTEDLSQDQALYELRQKLLGKVQHQAKKIRKSRHFVPIIAAVAVVFTFLFLQYNQVIFATVNAYVSPGSIDPQNIVIDPSAGNAVSQDPRLIIPKINVDVPVLYDVGTDHDSQMAAMEKGVAHFPIPGANSHPGEIGNTVLSGHSSNDLFDQGDYKFIFAQLDKLNIGDTLYANYKGTRYTYIVTKKEVVQPTEVNKLIYDTDKPVMTLITCTPLGTSLERLLVTAEQISPDPAAANAAPDNESSTDTSGTIPGASAPTLIERLFGAR